MDKFSRQAVFCLLSYALVGLAWRQVRYARINLKQLGYTDRKQEAKDVFKKGGEKMGDKSTATMAQEPKVEEFLNRHAAHVRKLLTQSDQSYEPSGSDRIRSELWKPAHWRWYLLMTGRM